MKDVIQIDLDHERVEIKAINKKRRSVTTIGSTDCFGGNQFLSFMSKFPASGCILVIEIKERKEDGKQEI